MTHAYSAEGVPVCLMRQWCSQETRHNSWKLVTVLIFWLLHLHMSSLHSQSEFKAHFKNITRIMECVGCDKCRLWGKLQVHGIGTALKVLFSDKRTGKLELSRREIVALFNVLGRSVMLIMQRRFVSIFGHSHACLAGFQAVSTTYRCSRRCRYIQAVNVLSTADTIRQYFLRL